MLKHYMLISLIPDSLMAFLKKSEAAAVMTLVALLPPSAPMTLEGSNMAQD